MFEGSGGYQVQLLPNKTPTVKPPLTLNTQLECQRQTDNVTPNPKNPVPVS